MFGIRIVCSLVLVTVMFQLKLFILLNLSYHNVRSCHLAQRRKLPRNCISDSWRVHFGNWQLNYWQRGSLLLFYGFSAFLFFIAIYTDIQSRFTYSLFMHTIRQFQHNTSYLLRFAANLSFKTRLKIFPLADFGISFRNSTPPRSCLYVATCSVDKNMKTFPIKTYNSHCIEKTKQIDRYI